MKQCEKIGEESSSVFFFSTSKGEVSPKGFVYTGKNQAKAQDLAVLCFGVPSRGRTLVCWSPKEGHQNYYGDGSPLP